MDLLIPDLWLRDFLDTKAKPKDIQKFLSLSGPTVDRVNNSSGKLVYEIEVTTNRPDAMSVFGIAREAAAILPRYNVDANLKKAGVKANQKLKGEVNYIDLEVERGLAARSAAILIRDIKVKKSPSFIEERLKLVGERPINNVVDITNYIMHELGQPVHAFDYDKISNHKMFMRKSKKGEKITTLDGKDYSLPQGGMVIEDGSGKLIDMPGIMGGLNSAVDENTKNVLLFVQTYDPATVRKMAMSLDKWSNAARLYEKNLDTVQIEHAIKRGIDLIVQYADGKPEDEILDIYIQKPPDNKIVIENEFIAKLLGIKVEVSEIIKILKSLGFETTFENNTFKVAPPSYRSKDIVLPQDVVEEIARIYGYQNIPGKLMAGEIPTKNYDEIFNFESKIKQILRGLGGSEVYTLSLTNLEAAGNNALEISNPLGLDSQYLRTSLRPSLVMAANENKHWDKPFHLFEIANIYLKTKGDLPNERMVLAGIFKNYNYRNAKGIIEVLLDRLNISNTEIKTHEIEKNIFYYETDLDTLFKNHKPYPTFKPLPQFPAQIEDLSLQISLKGSVGQVIKTMLSTDKNIANVELVDTYKDTATFRIWFQSPDKTLNNKEVKTIRTKLIDNLRSKNLARPKE